MSAADAAPPSWFIALPLTSRGAAGAEQVAARLARFARGVLACNAIAAGAARERRATLAVLLDDDDAVAAQCVREWCAGFGDAGVVEHARAVHNERALGLLVRVLAEPRTEPFELCRRWASAARAARDACDYFVLLGDDIDVRVAARARDDADADDDHRALADLVARPALDPLGAPWMPLIEAEFERARPLPRFGCVALNDVSSPGFPTFPVVPRTHFDVFDGELLPPGAFVNQHADPWLYEVYRRFGAARFAGRVLLRNECGGTRESEASGAAAAARYQRAAHSDDWRGALLSRSVARVRRWLRREARVGDEAARRAALAHVALDVLIPSYRCDLAALRRIVRAPAPPAHECSLQFIVVIDNPSDARAAHVAHALVAEHAAGRVRVRINAANVGCGASRNRALGESSAEWVLFLDDDVVPHAGMLAAYVRAIREHGARHCMMAGPTHLPPIASLQADATRLSGAAFFWDAPLHMRAVPWSVTANMLVRRSAVRFRPGYPPSGGGEDIDFALLHRDERDAALALWRAEQCDTGADTDVAAAPTEWCEGDDAAPTRRHGTGVALPTPSSPSSPAPTSPAAPSAHAAPSAPTSPAAPAAPTSPSAPACPASWPMLSVPDASAEHPWWPGGMRASLQHVFGWAWGDGLLVRRFRRRDTYRALPNASEMALFVLLAACAVAALQATRGLAATGLAALLLGARGSALATLAAGVACAVALLVVDALGIAAWNALCNRGWHAHIRGARRRTLGALGGALLHEASELGRLLGQLGRGHVSSLCRRFDWFCGLNAGAVREERARLAVRFAASAAVIVAMRVCVARW